MDKRPYRTFLCSIFILFLIFMGFQWLLRPDERDHSANMVEGRLEFGATYMTMNNPFFEIIDDEIRSAVEGHGDVLITRDPALDLEKQREQIYELIDRKVAAIFVNPVDWKGLGETLGAAKRAGIPVIAVDTPIYQEDLVTYTVVSDNYDAGVQCAKHLMSHSDGGKILLLEHPKAKSAMDRIQGFLDTIQADSRFEIAGRASCEGQLELAMPAMEGLLKEHPDVDIVMALNDPSAMGAMAALQDSGLLSRVMVYGVDGTAEAKSMIAEGIMTATSSQSPNQIGKLAVDRAYRILNGSWDESSRKELVPVTLITKENVSRYGTDGWK